jgi:APA family basic amino acid/polyamine antiporter
MQNKCCVASTQYTGIPWAKYVVAVGAMAGIVTGPLVGFYAGARIFCILGRDHLLPPFFASMNARFGTPAVATAIQGIAVCKLQMLMQVHQQFSKILIRLSLCFWCVQLTVLFFYAPEA